MGSRGIEVEIEISRGGRNGGGVLCEPIVESGRGLRIELVNEKGVEGWRDRYGRGGGERRGERGELQEVFDIWNGEGPEKVGAQETKSYVQFQRKHWPDGPDGFDEKKISDYNVPRDQEKPRQGHVEEPNPYEQFQRNH